MQYVTIKHFKRRGIGGEFNIHYGEILELRDDGLLYYKDCAVCAARSAAAHKYFACDYDGKGFYRGKLSGAIIERLEPKNFDSPQERDEFWKKIWKDKLTQKYRRPEHLDYWLWNDDFFNAPIEDLEYIAELVGVKKGLLENV